MNIKRVGIIGSGWVGGITGACLAEKGHRVICYDNQEKKIAQWKSDEMPFSEPELAGLVLKNRGKRLFFTSDINDAIKTSEIIFECVNTPQKEKGYDKGSFDVQFVDAVAREIAAHASGYKIIVHKSTLASGTVSRLEEIIKAANPKLKISAVSNPEFLAEGTGIKDFLSPSRVVIGTNEHDEAARKAIGELYYFVPKEKVLYTSIEEAELIKLGSNLMLAQRISTINVMAELAGRWNCDIKKISEGIGLDYRIGSRFLQAGVGFGGSCFKKDTASVKHMFKELHLKYHEKLVQSILDINKYQRENIIKDAKRALFSFPKKTIALYGLSFKPDTDDIRDAPAIDIAKKLMEEGAFIRICDPKTGHRAAECFKNKRHSNYSVCNDAYETAKGADMIILVTEWSCFKPENLNLKKIYKSMQKPAWIFDGRNIYEPKEVYEIGFNYSGIGRPKLIH